MPDEGRQLEESAESLVNGAEQAVVRNTRLMQILAVVPL